MRRPAREQAEGLPPPSGQWRVVVGRPEDNGDIKGQSYLTENAARDAAKHMGGGFIYIVPPTGKSYKYVKQPKE